MKKTLTILHSLRPRTSGATKGRRLRRLCRHGLTLGLTAGICSFLCVCLSMEKTGGVLALAALVCLWAHEYSEPENI